MCSSDLKKVFLNKNFHRDAVDGAAADDVARDIEIIIAVVFQQIVCDKAGNSDVCVIKIAGLLAGIYGGFPAVDRNSGTAFPGFRSFAAAFRLDDCWAFSLSEAAGR